MYDKILATPPNQVEAEVPHTVQFDAIPESPNELDLAYEHYEKFHADINAAISEFNAAQNPEAKKAALIKIQHTVEYVDLHSPSNLLAESADFHALKKELFNKVKQAFAENGVNTLLKIGGADSPIARILSDMSLDKADQLMEILHQGITDMSERREALIQECLKNLYDADDTTAEAEQWRVFFRNHDITFLGGHNSRNYKVTNKEPTDPHYGTVKILKVDNRIEMPRNIEHYLHNALSDVFVPIDAARQVRGEDDEEELVSRTLLVTDLCALGSVDEYALHTHSQGEAETFRECGNMIGQMAQVFMRIQEANCCFPDSKISNWLVDEEGKIRISDSKSLVFTKDGVYSIPVLTADGSYRTTIPGNEYAGIRCSRGYEPKEINYSSFNAEKLHASILGRNIYAYLTGEPPSAYEQKFNHPIFKTKIGAEYKQLIEQLIQDPPEQRPSISDAYKQIKELTEKVTIDNSVKTFKEFQEKYKEQIGQRDNVDFKSTAPKI